MMRPSASRRITAAILGANRPGNRPSAVARQRRLPLGRRLLTSVLGVQAGPPMSSASPRNAPKGTAIAPQTGGTSRSDPPPDTPSPPPPAQHRMGPSRYEGGGVRPRTPSEDREEYGSRSTGSVAPRLLSEDSPDYERTLGDALRHAHERPDLAGVGDRLTTEQLRTMALNATALITAAAATEYEHYVKIRGELRRSAPSSLSSSVSAPGSADPGARTGATGLAAAGRRDYSAGGAGPVALVAVLTPVLAGGAAVLSLLVGFILKMLAPESAFARTLFTTGWFLGAVAAAAILVAVFGLLMTALRSGSASISALSTLSPEETEDALPEEVARAREAWRHALLERGILPFLRDALSDPTAGPASRTQRPAAIPETGYGRPPFTSPDFTSPDFAGPIESTPSTGPDPSD